MNQSEQIRFLKLAKSLRELLFAKCIFNCCKVVPFDSSLRVYAGTGGMIPHSAIVLIYRFVLDNNLLMYFDSDNPSLVLH